MIKWIEIVLTQFLLGLTGIAPPCRIKDALKRCCKWSIIIKYWGAAQNAFNCVFLSCHIRRHEDIIINSMTQTREKWNPRFRLEMTFEWYEGAMVFRVFIFFLLRTNGKNKPLGENDFRHGYGNCWEKTILKVTCYELCSKFFSKITRNIDNGIWKTPCSRRFYKHGSTCVLILFWVNNIKQKCAKVPETYQLYKNLSLFLKNLSLIIAFSFFSQKNLVFKFILTH